jgi:ferredoxin
MDDGYAHAIVDPVPHEEYDCAREAAEICPVEAIAIVGE